MKRSYVFKICLCTLLLTSTLIFLACDRQCQHVNMTASVTEPTHIAQGFTTYTCSDCDYSYTSDHIPPVGHTLASQTVEPTCAEQGYTHFECSCGYEFYSDFVAPLGHTLSVQQVDPTCDTEGYDSATCTVCGEHYTYTTASPLGHVLQYDWAYVSVHQPTASIHYSCDRCELDRHGDLLYSDVYQGAYVENTTVLAKGIDVSYHNHEQNADGTYTELDWAHIKSQGYDFAILRAGYMNTGNQLFIDPVFESNYSAAKAAGLDVGAYFFSYAYSVEDAAAEAQALLTLLEGKQFEYPIFFDIEYSHEKIAELGLSRSDITDICVEFISILQSNGYFAALYTNNDWLVNYLDAQRITALFDVWYARYVSSADAVTEAAWDHDKYGRQMSMWQFSSSGIIDGIYYKYKKDESGAASAVIFDMNYAYKDYPSLIRRFGLNGYGEATPLPAR